MRIANRFLSLVFAMVQHYGRTMSDATHQPEVTMCDGGHFALVGEPLKRTIDFGQC